MIPSVGRIVHYRLASHDLGRINSRIPGEEANPHHEGQRLPMLICRVFADHPDENTVVNGQVFLDGNFTLWKCSVQQGDGAGRWHQPPVRKL